MDYEALLAEKDAIIAAQNARFEKLNVETSSRILQLEHELAQLKKMIFGSKRERFIADINPQQLSLFISESTQENITPLEEKQHIIYDRNAPKKHNGRNELPEHLPVHEVIIEPEEDTTGMVRIGEEITETLEYTQACLVKKRTIRPKYARPNNEGVVIASLPSRPLPKGIAEASLIAYITISKFIDHLPFHRLIQIFKRDFKWNVTDSTINEWFVSECILLQPLYLLLKRKILESSYIQADESPIKVLDRDHVKGVHQGYQWVYYSPELKLVLFNYRKGRGQNGPKEILSQYTGILQADGWHVYDNYADKQGIVLAGCMAHVRRKFTEALKTHKVKSEEALMMIQQLYAHERLCKGMLPQDRKKYRQEYSVPVFDQIRNWLDEEKKKVIEPESAYGKAITYITRQWHKLIRVLEDGRIEIDNNLIENKIRPLALGRKNYLFAGSHDAAQRIAMMYSFFGSCKAHDINPYDWLKITLEKISDTKLSELESLLPGAGV